MILVVGRKMHGRRGAFARISDGLKEGEVLKESADLSVVGLTKNIDNNHFVCAGITIC